MSSQTKRSTRKLSEVARHVVVPSGIVSTAWPAVEARCAEFGDTFDEWQRGAGMVSLGKRADGDYAATVGGITWSIPRQVAKTFLALRIIVALCTLFPNLTVLWSAHRTRTASKTFGSLRAYVSRKSVAPYVLSVRAVNGEQEVHFINGSVIMFGAREQGFGRGFDEVDIEVFDEAQILTEKALEDMVAATNQSRFPAGALLFFMGTPPRPVDPGEVFKGRRREALAGETEDAVYIECSADPDADPDDREQWAVANPSYPHRTPLRSMLRLRKNLPSAESWKREALGIWDSDQEGSRYFTAETWMGCEGFPAEGKPAYAVAFSVDGTRLAVGGYIGSADAGHVELIDVFAGDVEAGLASLADWFVGKNPDGVARWKAASSLVFAGSAGASVLKQYLVERKVPARRVTVATTPQYLQACAMFREAVENEHSVTHLAGQDALDASVRVTDQDRRGGWRATIPDGDETPLEAVSLALWGAKTSRQRSGEAVFR